MVRPADPGRTLVEVTDGRFTDTDPVFTADGLYLAFLSWRSFDPVYDAHVFDLSFPYGRRPFGNDRSKTCASRSEEHTSELQSPDHTLCRLLLEKKNYKCALVP